ncbi:MAG TPA: hypothetical protein VNG69_13355 [Casimicrobiaceae bacterium]|nr:hypothetical protein [Casimicrobiaceae bacterium]
MRSKTMRMTIVGLIALSIAVASHAQRLPDEPAPRTVQSIRSSLPASYAAALAMWKSPEDIAQFIDATFQYDRARALELAENPDGSERRAAIHAPEALFAKPAGVCVDLARFGVETLHRIDTRYQPRYLMIEFEPITVSGRTLRRHWVALFERDSALWAFADSWRPGHVAGPYPSLDAFIADYALARDRKIVAWQLRDGFERRKRAHKNASLISR